MPTDNGIIKGYDRFISSLFSGCPEYDVTDKPRAISNHMRYMFARTQSMFKYNGLPDTIPERMLELYLQTNGNVCIYKYGENVYAFTGGMGGEPDPYYRPTVYTIANPALKISKNLEIDRECVVIPNDSLYIGLRPMFSRYASAMTETEISINIASINARIIDLISAPDERTRASAEKYLENVKAGKLGIIAENGFLDGVRSQPYGNSNNVNGITSLIELEQYIKASWYNDLGLNANYNMKRESLNSSESQMNNDALLPLVDDMLKCRKEGVEKVNNMYGLNITVELASAWEDNAEEISLEHEALSGQPENKEGVENIESE